MSRVRPGGPPGGPAPGPRTELAASTGFTLRLLGGFAVEVDGQSVLPLPPVKVCALLAYLAVEARPVARATLADLLWPEAAPPQAALSLRVALSALRRLAPDRIETRAKDVAFLPRPGDYVDIGLLRQALARDDRDLWRQAAAAYAGPFLAGHLAVDTPAFRAWLAATEPEIAQQARRVLLRVAETLAGEQPAEALHCLHRAAAIDPFHEPTQRQVILALARRGEQGAALARLEALREALAAELGVDPEPETLALRERIAAARQRRADPPSRRPLPLTPFLGRAREVAVLEQWLAAPAAEREPGVETVDTGPPADPGHPRAGRLVTMTGPGGIGKTRLALEVAERMGHRLLDGACFVSLAGLDPVSPFELSLAVELGLEPVAGTALGDQLAQALQPRELLLVLDNFEHLVAQAGRLAELLAAGPGLRILVTSREGLGLPFERVLAVDGLTFPPKPTPAGPGDAYDAVDLFVAAARRIVPDFDPAPVQAEIDEICRLVGGMPLALELAAPWTAEASCVTIVERLRADMAALPLPRGLPARHAGLDAVLEHTWALLSGAERLAFAKLCVFRGGFDGPAARAVAGVSAADLSALGRKSLVYPVGEGRHDIHEFLRVSGIRRLEAAPSLAATVYGAHARYYLSTLATLIHRDGAESRSVVAFVEANADNLAAAWRQALAQGHRALLAAVAVDLVGIYFAQGPLDLGRTCCDEVIGLLRAEREDEDDPDRRGTVALLGRMLAERAVFEHSAGHSRVAEDSVGQALGVLATLAPEPADWPAAARAGASVALRLRGVLRRAAGRYGEAVADLDAARAHAEAAGDARLAAEAAYHRAGVEAYRGQTRACVEATAAVLRAVEGQGLGRLSCALSFTLSALYDRLGELDQAAASAERCLDLARDAGYRLGEMNAQAAMGLARYRAGAFAAAHDHQERAVQLAVDRGHHVAERNARLGLAVTLLDLGQSAEALHHIDQTRRQAQAEGFPRTLAFATLLRAAAKRRAHDYVAADDHARESLAAFEATHDAAGAAMARAEFGIVQARLGEAGAAAVALDRAIGELAAAGEATQILTARLHRLRLGLAGGIGDATVAAALALREAVAGAGLRGLLAPTDLVIGRLHLASEPATAAPAFTSALEGFTALGQSHLALEAVAGLLYCPGGLEDGSPALAEAQARTATLLRNRLFGVEDLDHTLGAFRAALTVLGDPRLAALDDLSGSRDAGVAGSG